MVVLSSSILIKHNWKWYYLGKLHSAPPPPQSKFPYDTFRYLKKYLI